MNIAKRDYDKLVAERDYLQARHEELRDTNRDQRNQIGNFDEILDKIIRTASGLPLIQNRDVNAMSMGVNFSDGYRGQDHRCTIPTEIEVLRCELAEARANIVNMESLLASVRAVATFAKEHKA